MQAGSSKPASGSKQQAEIDVKKLSQDDIRQLMRNDPRFFTRLIAQLDKQMHNMMRENQMRQKQMEADKKEIAQIDHTLKIHVYNNMEQLNDSIKHKTEQRDNLKKQLAEQAKNMAAMQAEATKLIQTARHKTGRLLKQTAVQRLEEARGFSTQSPTSTQTKRSTTSASASSPSTTKKL